MMDHGLLSGAAGTHVISEQGTRMGRRSLLHISIHDAGIDVGGYTTPLVDATMTLK
jgi:hypothetical protein